MKEFFVDIENTLIDDLYSCNLLEAQTKQIGQFIHNRCVLERIQGNPPVKVNLFTWGWKTKDEIRDYVVNWLFEAMEVPVENRGTVWTKDDSIECAYRHGWINTKDEMQIEDLHVPGAMKRFGLDKQQCFVQQVMDLCEFPSPTGLDCEYTLIDDTNDDRWQETRELIVANNRRLTIMLLHPKLR